MLWPCGVPGGRTPTFGGKVPGFKTRPERFLEIPIVAAADIMEFFIMLRGNGLLLSFRCG